MQSSFEEHFQLIVFQKLSDWKLEKSCMRKHTCHLDFRQRFLYVTIGQKNWVQKLLNSHEEKFNTQNSSNQPNQFQNQSVIDQGNLITNTKCLLIKAKHPGQERSRRHLFTKNSVLQIDQGNLISRLAWLQLRQICLKKSELSKLTIDQGNLINMKSHYEQYIVRLRRSTPTMS